jgi:WD40 repeat protein/serine/threonine protein kinase
MSAESPKLDSIFCDAIEIADPEERAAYLDQVCGTDDRLRRRVELLVAAHFEAGGFLKTATVSANDTRPFLADSTTNPAASAEAGTMLGPYRLLAPIGEGGMGAVWLAEQSEPLLRKVALKLIKPGMDSAQVIARFETERQALALMDHPGIARVFDAGTTIDGRPFFVMELVDGTPITRFCDTHRLTVPERLRLFIAVCHAVQHAHQKGIIHRDLKPSNVLVTLVDGKPVPKVIDFGIAKATGPALTDQSVFTQVGSIVGTLEYMSPEQAELLRADIDTRSDVYSLGVLLYELLTGTTPLDRARLKDTALLEVLRRIREEEPPRASARLTTLDGLSAVANKRGVTASQLPGLVRGDLDWILMKCLEKERERRYESASALAEDLERHLRYEPVQARPPSAWYRFRKFARRNVAALVVAGVVLAALLLSVVVLAVSNVLIRTESEAKVKAEEERADKEKDRANEERDKRLALEGWEQTAHYLRLGQVLTEYRANRVKDAEELLANCNPQLRAWEWHYLHRLTQAAHTVADVGPLSQTLTAFSSDGTRLAVLGKDGPVVYDTTTWKEPVKLPLPGHAVLAAVFSPDGKSLALAGALRGQALVSVWDAVTGKARITLDGAPGHGAIGPVAFSPDGSRLVGANGRGDVFLWDLATGEELVRLGKEVPPAPPGRPSPPSIVTFTATGRILAARPDDPVLRAWDAETGQPVESVEPLTGHDRIAFSPRGTWMVTTRTIASLQPDRTIHLWDTRTGKIRHVFPGHSRPIDCLAFSPDEKFLATGSWDNSVTVWDTATGLEVGTYRSPRYGRIPLYGPGQGMVAVSFTAEGKQVVSVSADGSIRTWDATRSPEGLRVGERVVFPAAFSPDSRYVVGCGPLPQLSNRATIFIWDATTGEEVQAFGVPGAFPSEQVTFSPDSRFLAAPVQVGNGRSRVNVWEAVSGQLVRTFPSDDQEPILPCQLVAYSPDGSLIAAAGGGRTIYVWEVATGQEKYRLGGHPWTVSGLAFSGDGRRLASGTGGFFIMESDHGDFDNAVGDVKVWDMTSGAELFHLKTRRSRGLALNRDGTVVATSASGSIQIYNVDTGEKIVRPRWKVRGDYLAFSPDGKRLVTGRRSQDFVKIWDAQTGEEILALDGVFLGVAGVAFSPDGNKILATSGMLTVKIWDATPLPEIPR